MSVSSGEAMISRGKPNDLRKFVPAPNRPRYGTSVMIRMQEKINYISYH
jgi:hypothetical protein